MVKVHDIELKVDNDRLRAVNFLFGEIGSSEFTVAKATMHQKAAYAAMGRLSKKIRKKLIDKEDCLKLYKMTFTYDEAFFLYTILMATKYMLPLDDIHWGCIIQHLINDLDQKLT